MERTASQSRLLRGIFDRLRPGRVEVTGGFLLLAAGLNYLDRQGIVPLALLSCSLHELGHLLAIYALGGHAVCLRLSCVGAELRLSARDRLRPGAQILSALAGPLVNLAAGDGHPAEIMDMSFAVQAMSAEYLVRTRGQLKPGVVSVPAEIDDNIARRKLKAMGVSIDSLSCSQKEYLNG